MSDTEINHQRELKYSYFEITPKSPITIDISKFLLVVNEPTALQLLFEKGSLTFA